MAYTNLTGKRRSTRSNFLLGLVLAMVAGAINAGGFFLVMQYTSHMTGIISLAADSAAIGEYFMALQLIGYILCFIIGAICTTIITLYAKRYHLHSQFALPLLLEALILTVFSVVWLCIIPQGNLISCFIATLSFVMGQHNALITKVSSAIIRTTHITGMATDLGIEIGRLVSGTKDHNPVSTKNNIRRHTFIIFAFFTGGVLGAMGVNIIGALTFVILALLLVILGYPQFRRDYLFFVRNAKRKRR